MGISDDGGAFRNDFREKLRKLNIRHNYSSAYHPESNSLAERAVGSLKCSLRKSPKVMSAMALKEIIFQINSNMKGKNKRKIVYPVGTHVRIQHAKTKLFD